MSAAQSDCLKTGSRPRGQAGETNALQRATAATQRFERPERADWPFMHSIHYLCGASLFGPRAHSLRALAGAVAKTTRPGRRGCIAAPSAISPARQSVQRWRAFCGSCRERRSEFCLARNTICSISLLTYLIPLSEGTTDSNRPPPRSLITTMCVRDAPIAGANCFAGTFFSVNYVAAAVNAFGLALIAIRCELCSICNCQQRQSPITLPLTAQSNPADITGVAQR